MSNFSILILGVSIIFIATTAGSALVYLFRKRISEKVNSQILGFASGVMVAASVWSLIIPSVEQSAGWGVFNFIPASIGILLGGVFLVLLDKLIRYIQNNNKGRSNCYKYAHCKLFVAVTIHNIPEGLAVGMAFGAAIAIGQTAAYYSALALAIGIAIQNIPEGSAISLPMREELKSKHKAFFFGMLSGTVEPVAAVVGIILAALIADIMPWLLAFAAGAMLFVVAEDLLPEAKIDYGSHLGTWGFILGFITMMTLDISLG